MESALTILIVLIIGLFGLYILYQAFKNWKFLVSYIFMPLAGLSVMALALIASQFNDTVHPLLLGMAGVAIGGLAGHWLALRKNWV
jgi:O-antigen/teichoic acid export membrane protein